ncbi:unnamed protein product [Durusdinium trenchii]|uniref:alpha-amylase n=1 Tax=Durusdinium trenchii TaxID=1381693 RepID=A0ABP0S382_9DINO
MAKLALTWWWPGLLLLLERPAEGSCPDAEGFNEIWGCPAESLGPELLADTAFGNTATWGTYLKDTGLASFSFTGHGVVVDPLADEDDTPWHVQITQPITLDQGGEDPAYYALCVRAASDKAGVLHFAVDAGAALNFAIAGGGSAGRLQLREGQEATGACFSFRLGPSSYEYEGRVVLDLGAFVERSEVCQISLRRCSSKPAARGLKPLRRCYLAPLEEGAGCTLLEVQRGVFYDVNRYGQETTAKRSCLQETRRLKGDSFVFAVGRCEIWRCERRSNLVTSATSSQPKELFSELCDYDEEAAGYQGTQRRSPVYIQLWEWNFEDIAKECVRYLGPNGISGVQISPVTEHILGTQWYTKYQPIGFGLNSRSGNMEQLVKMIIACRSAGVQVMVDVILNHIAAPCPSALEAGYAAVMPCTGWAGSSYGNRRINTQDGWKGPEFFHNILGNLMGNCPVEEPSFTCPQSDPPGDCTQCDFKGLPDWNTGLQGTRETLAKHLMELHDVGVTMIRIDAASYMSWEDTAAIINQLPWDVVHQEWWGGIPAPERSEAVGHYRDQKYGLKITNALAVGDVNYLSEMLNISTGLEGIPSERAVYPLTFHDARTWEADRFIPTFMNGLEFHQQQKFLLAWPKGMAVRLWGGYTFTNMDAGPPGECGNGRCQPFPVYLFEDEEPRCMPTPQNSPLSEEEKEYEGWICEHRWEGIAGLINFRQACRGLPITSIWSSSDGSASLGQYAWRATQGQQQCFAALVRGFNTRWPGPWGHLGDWRLAGMATGLPPGRYCDLASLSTQKCWDRRRCPREVSIDADGVVLTGVVREGDLLAIHTSARLSDSTEPFVCGQTEELSTASSATVPLLVGALAMGFLTTSGARPRVLDLQAVEEFHIPTEEEKSMTSCDGMREFRKGSWLEVPLNATRLRPKAERQMRVAVEVIHRNHSGPVFHELRSLEQRRWNEENANFTFFNPSLVRLPNAWKRHEDERWLAAFRHMEASAELYPNCAPLGISNVIVLAVLDDDFRITRPVELLTEEDCFPEKFQCVDAKLSDIIAVGPEDPKLFPVGDGVFVFFTGKMPSEHFMKRCGHPVGRMFVAEIAADLQVHHHRFTVRMESEIQNASQPLINKEPFHHWEKNWSPFIYKDEDGEEHLMAQEDVEPQVVVSMDHQFIAGQQVYNTSSPQIDAWVKEKQAEADQQKEILLPGVHGGCSPLLITEPIEGLEMEPPFYLSILHVRTLKDGQYLVYHNFFYLFDASPPFAVRHVLRKEVPLLPGPSVFPLLVAFATQLLRLDDVSLVVLFGMGDARAKQLRLPLSQLQDFI